MRLASVSPPIAQALLAALARCGIRTDADLLFSASASDLHTHLGTVYLALPSGTTTFEELSDVAARVAEQASAGAATGDALLVEAENMESEQHEITTGIPALDQLMNGLGASVLEVSGDKGSGKTTLALNIALRHLARDSLSSVLWLDTLGDFPAPRLGALYSAVAAARIQDDDGGADSATPTALDRLQVALAFDLDAAHQVLDALWAALSTSAGSGSPRVKLLVIDTITPLLGPALSAVSSQGHAIMTTFMRQLRTLARTFSLPILVLNSATGSGPREGGPRHPNAATGGSNPLSAFATTTRKPALGPSFTYLTDGTLWLSRAPPSLVATNTDADQSSDVVQDEGQVIVAEVFRSRSTRQKTWCAFKLRSFDGAPIPLEQ